MIGESDDDGSDRIPNAAGFYSAIYFHLGYDPQGEPYLFTDDWVDEEDAELLWWMNQGWIETMMLRQSLFYDIGRYMMRSPAGRYYPCERVVMGSYIDRLEVAFQGTSSHNPGNCEFNTYPNVL